MNSEKSKLSRRNFMIASSAAVAAPMLLNLSGSATEAKGAEKKSTSKQGKIYFINRTCIGCQVCRIFCPANAIIFGNCQNEIDQDKCIHCGTCYKECPISVISETSL